MSWWRCCNYYRISAFLQLLYVQCLLQWQHQKYVFNFTKHNAHNFWWELIVEISIGEVYLSWCMHVGWILGFWCATSLSSFTKISPDWLTLIFCANTTSNLKVHVHRENVEDYYLIMWKELPEAMSSTDICEPSTSHPTQSPLLIILKYK